jgi:hypothetical protein
MSLFGGFTPRDKAVEYASSSTAFEDVNLPSFLKSLSTKMKLVAEGFLLFLQRNCSKLEKRWL